MLVPDIDALAAVDDSAQLGEGTRVWGLAQVREKARLGRGCTVGRGAYVDRGVQVGDHVKIQNFALLYHPAVLEDGVFVGPSAVFTNDRTPRAVTPAGQVATSGDWSAVGVVAREGASIGARAVCVGPVTLGRWSMVGAGAVVTEDVADFALVVGVPARRVGWVGKAGHRLQEEGNGSWRCSVTGSTYVEVAGGLAEGEPHG